MIYTNIILQIFMVLLYDVSSWQSLINIPFVKEQCNKRLAWRNKTHKKQLHPGYVITTLIERDNITYLKNEVERKTPVNNIKIEQFCTLGIDDILLAFRLYVIFYTDPFASFDLFPVDLCVHCDGFIPTQKTIDLWRMYINQRIPAGPLIQCSSCKKKLRWTEPYYEFTKGNQCQKCWINQTDN